MIPHWLTTSTAEIEQTSRAQVQAAYQIALARPATEGESRVGVDLIAKRSLQSFTHVVLNLDEFIYMR